jgi:lipid-binding SYLF domain-containing protein
MTNQTRQLAFDPDAPSKYLNAPVSFSMTAEISKAAHSIENIFGHVPNAMIKIDRIIPEALMKNAKGVAFLTILKGGFLVSGKIGTGLVIAKLDKERYGYDWSAPSAIGTVGLGWGAQIGGEITDFVIVLTTIEALETFSGASQVALGAELGVSVGPFGRNVDASLNIGDRGLAPVYAYSQSSGLFAGISLEGAVISARADVNRRFYGKDFAPRDILSGAAVAPPRAAAPLYQVVDKVFSLGYRTQGAQAGVQCDG